MAGIRKKALRSGKWQAWFVRSDGKMEFFVGTRDREETLRMAQRLEDDHRQVRLGYRPASKASDKHKGRPFSEVRDEYLAWSQAQGGRGGRPWAARHLVERKRGLDWWKECLGLRTLADLDGVLPRAEKALREYAAGGRGAKTVRNVC